MTGTDGAPVTGAAPAALEKLWSKTRQGAATVAGVRYQVAASAALAAGSRRGPIRCAQVRPEGFEDIDCLRDDGTHVLVQAKDRAGGTTTWTRADMADAIAHAVDVLKLEDDARLLLLTNAAPGQGLCDTGWAGSLAQALPAADRETLLKAVQKRVSTVDVAILDRCGLRCEPLAGLNDMAVEALAAEHTVPRAIAQIAVCVLQDELAGAADDQRFTGVVDARTVSASDVDALVHRVVSSVNVELLESAVASGLVAPVDFATPIAIPLERFLLGVDVRPGHIAAELDLARSEHTVAVFDALAAGRGAVICGPSGAGKSALLWRCARELEGSARTVQLHRAGVENVDAIERWIRLQRPSPSTPVVLCADDLGRPALDAWPQLAARLADQPGVLLLASCREEDLTPGRYADLEVLRPRLEEPLAERIAAELTLRGVQLRQSATEAFGNASGLLLEYLTLLTQGQRLTAVVDAQVHARLDTESVVERDALRYVSAAHLAGIAVPFDDLGTLVADSAALPAALTRLQREFLVTDESADGWAGLHRLRSLAAHAALHRAPPPTVASTFGRLVRTLAPALAAHAVRAASDLDVAPADLSPFLAEAVRDTDAEGAATLIEAAIDADALIHARACWKHALTGWGAPGADTAVYMAYVARFGGAPGAAPSRPVRELAASLPPPPAAAGHTAGALSLVDPEWLTRLAVAAPSTAAVRLVEVTAATGSSHLSVEQARSVLEVHEAIDHDDYGRLVHSLSAQLPHHETWPEALGPRDRRLDRAAAADDRVLEWAAEERAGVLIVTAEVFVTDGQLDHELRHRFGRLLFNLCPEADRLQLITRAPRAVFSAVPAQPRVEFTQSDMPSPQVRLRRTRAFRDGLDRLRAADSWTERQHKQAELCERLRELLVDSRTHLAWAHQNMGRRKAWIAAARDCAAELTRLPSAPLTYGPGARRSADAARDLLQRTVTALQALASHLSGRGAVALGGVGLGLRDVARELAAHLDRAGDPLTRHIAEALHDEIVAVARLLLVLHLSPGATIARKSPGGSVTEAVDAMSLAAAARVDREDQALLRAALDGIDVEIFSVDNHAAAVPGPQLLVVVGAGRRNEAVWDRLDRLNDDTRDRIAFRVTVVHRYQGLLPPTEGWVIGSKRVYPADPAELRSLGLAADIPLLDTPALTAGLQVLRGIVDASALCSLAAARRRSRFDESRAVAAAQAELARCRARLGASELLAIAGPAAPAAANLVDMTERELAGELVMSQIVGDVLLRTRGDENIASLAMSATRGLIVGVAAQLAATTTGQDHGTAA